MTKNRPVRLSGEIAADAEAVARVGGTNVNETVRLGSYRGDRRRRKDAFRASLRRIVKNDLELLELLAK